MWLKGGEMNEVKTSERQRGRAREERIDSQMKTDTHRSEMRLWLIRAGSALAAQGAGQPWLVRGLSRHTPCKRLIRWEVYTTLVLVT